MTILRNEGQVFTDFYWIKRIYSELSNNTDISSLKALSMTLALVSVGVVLKSVFYHDYNAGNFYKEKSNEANNKGSLTLKNITDVNQAINNYTEVRKLWNNGDTPRHKGRGFFSDMYFCLIRT